MSFVSHIDWIKIKNDLSQGDKRYSIIDNFLPTNVVDDLHDQLLNNQMWRIKNPLSKHLHNAQPNTPIVKSVLVEVDQAVRKNIDKNLHLTDYWCLLYANNTDGNVHADFGNLTFTYWLTKDEFNLDENSGGLKLYDVLRPESMPMSEYLSVGDQSRRYVEDNSRGEITKIKYKRNRAVLFDSRIFHKTDQPNFEISKPHMMRMNLTCVFHDENTTNGVN